MFGRSGDRTRAFIVTEGRWLTVVFFDHWFMKASNEAEKVGEKLFESNFELVKERRKKVYILIWRFHFRNRLRRNRKNREGPHSVPPVTFKTIIDGSLDVLHIFFSMQVIIAREADGHSFWTVKWQKWRKLKKRIIEGDNSGRYPMKK